MAPPAFSRKLTFLTWIICTNCVAPTTFKTFLYEDPTSGLTRTCELCPPGSRLFSPCDRIVNDTVCMECAHGTFTSGWNHFDHCRPLKKCPPGMGAKKLGSIKANTKCEKCPPGSFSDVSSFIHPCFFHTPCLEIGMILVFEGNSTHDSVCGFPMEQPKNFKITASLPNEDTHDLEENVITSTRLPDLQPTNWTTNSTSEESATEETTTPMFTTSDVSTTKETKVREDDRCGEDWPSPDGKNIGECDPYSDSPCCSPLGYCGGDEDHCDCDNCIDFRILQEGDIDSSSILDKGGYAAITLAVSTVVIMAVIAIVWHKKQRERKIKEREIQKYAKKMSRKQKKVDADEY